MTKWPKPKPRPRPKKKLSYEALKRANTTLQRRLDRREASNRRLARELREKTIELRAARVVVSDADGLLKVMSGVEEHARHVIGQVSTAMDDLDQKLGKSGILEQLRGATNMLVHVAAQSNGKVPS